MSRIGNKEILIPAGVTIIQNGQTLEVTGPKGKMEYTFDENVAINIHDNKIKITRHGDENINAQSTEPVEPSFTI